MASLFKLYVVKNSSEILAYFKVFLSLLRDSLQRSQSHRSFKF